MKIGLDALDYALIHKPTLLDAEHICQNLCLAVEAIGCGACAIGGYVQDGAVAFFDIGGQEEYSVYCASIGRIHDASGG